MAGRDVVPAAGRKPDTAADGRALDVHTHAIPLPMLEYLADRGLADLSEVPGAVLRLDPAISGLAPGTPFQMTRSLYDVPLRLADMDAAGVSHHAVSLPPFLLAGTTSDDRLALDVVRLGNDELAVHVADAPDRLIGLGAVPVGRPGAVVEAQRCLDELGLPGVVIGSGGEGRELDAPANDELWSLLAERRAFVLLHPNARPGPAPYADPWLPQLVGYPIETTYAVTRLVFGRVLERHALVLCLAHGGGCLPALRGRLDAGWASRTAARTPSVPPSRFTDRLYYDTAVFDITQLRRLTEDVGAEHIVLGTDHPFELRDRTPIETVRALGLDRRSTRAVLWDNAAELLGVAAGTATTAPGV